MYTLMRSQWNKEKLCDEFVVIWNFSSLEIAQQARFWLNGYETLGVFYIAQFLGVE